MQKEIGRFQPHEQIVSSKYRKIARNLGYLSSRTQEETLIASEAVDDEEHFLILINLVRLTLADLTVESVAYLVEHYNLEGINDCKSVTEAIAAILVQGQVDAIDSHCLDYSDMIWLPVYWRLDTKPWFRTYQWVLTDEAQDLNAAQLELSLALAGDKGRLIFVGDRSQAILGFAGADNRSFDKIVQRTQAKELPLSLCYRCPQSHVELVNDIYPQIPIQATPQAKMGILRLVEEENLWQSSHPACLVVGDMVLSRKTAPLVSLCIKLIAIGIAATVRGKDIGKQIVRELEGIAKVAGFKFKEFNVYLEKYREFKFRAYKDRDNEAELKENLSDKLNALTYIYSSQPNAKSIEDLAQYIYSLFSDDESPITLSTVHRAKGLEGERIFIIKPEDLPMEWKGQKVWQAEQEDNLLYVALTRSKSELYIVGEPDWMDDDNEIKTKDNREKVKGEREKVKARSQTTTTKSQLDLDIIRKEIQQMNYQERCELLDWLQTEVNQEKWQQVSAYALAHSDDSDRAIARACNVSAPFVAKVRKQLAKKSKQYSK